jgi:Na+/H+ antiporter NhaD/arsenite permease-like protein
VTRWLPRTGFLGVLPLFAAAATAPALAVSPDSAISAFNGTGLSLLWGIPFAGLLLSIALVPMFAASFWHHHYGKVATAWAVALLVPFAAVYGSSVALHHVVHALLLEYLPFVIVLFALYTIAGGIALRGRMAGTPTRNTVLLAIGAALASIMGTTGASMLLVRPLLAGNATRRYRVHAVVFFILLVGNIGGALSPLGDPPLFIGFLKGVDFFWTTTRLLLPTLLLCAYLLGLFFIVDWVLARRDSPVAATPAEAFGVDGVVNLVLLTAVVGVVLMSGIWKPDITFEIYGTPMELQNVERDLALLVLAGVSLAITPRGIRERNVFHWEPIIEVAKLFAGIFITIVPVIAILQAGRSGQLGPVADMVTAANGDPSNGMYFLITGLLSAFLDNAPTYLVFFNLAGGNPQELMSSLGGTLGAISMGAVYFGALTYVGNAPNFMIRAIAEDRGVPMPAFFTYLGWTLILLGPPLALIWVTVG